MRESRADGRAVDLGGQSVYQEGPKFEIKHKSRCLQKSKLVNWMRGQECRLEEPGPSCPPPPLAPALGDRIPDKRTKRKLVLYFCCASFINLFVMPVFYVFVLFNQPVSSIVKTLLLVREVLGSIPELVIPDAVSPTVRHRCSVSSELSGSGVKPRR